jgi:Halocarboxylic acid dehydrogenase DehI
MLAVFEEDLKIAHDLSRNCASTLPELLNLRTKSAIRRYMPWNKGQRLRLATPEEAPAGVTEIYAEMQSAMGVPFVDELHQAYGMCPVFLQEHWTVAEPIVRSREFQACAERLGADAYTRIHSYISIPNIEAELALAQVSEASRQDIRACVELFCRRAKSSLLLCAWQMRAFEGPVGQGSAEESTPPKAECRPIIVKDDAMPAETKKVLEDIRKKTESPALDTYYRAIARWPDLLCDFWRRMSAEMASPMYENCRKAIRDYALQLCDELPGPAELTTVKLLESVDEGEIASLVKITEAFENSLSALVLNVTWTHIGLEGGNSAPGSRIPAERNINAA